MRGERPNRFARQQSERKSSKHEHAGQSDNERGYLEIGDPVTLSRANDAARDKAQNRRRHEIQARFYHQDRGKRSNKACHRAHRQVDVARYDHQQHTQRHDDDVAVLENQVREVEWLEQSAVCQDLEEHHDHDQCDHKPVLPQVAAGGPGSCCLGGRCRWCCCRIHYSLFPLRMMARMILS